MSPPELGIFLCLPVIILHLIWLHLVWHSKTPDNSYEIMSTTSNNESQAARLTANKVASELRRLISLKKRATLVIDAHGLPDTFFNFLLGSEGIDWTQVIVILAREFTGVNGEHPR